MKLCFFFFFFTVQPSGRKNKACQFPQPEEKGFSYKRPCPQLASPITPPGVKSGGLPSFLGVPWKIPKGWTLKKSLVGLQWTRGKSSHLNSPEPHPTSLQWSWREAMPSVSSAKRTIYLPKTWLSRSRKALGGSQFISWGLTGVFASCSLQ